MNLFLVLLMFVAVMLVFVGYVKATHHCPPRKVEYRYVPRTFIEESEDPTPISDIFASMFFESSPYMSHETGKGLPPPNLQQKDINARWISQA